MENHSLFIHFPLQAVRKELAFHSWMQWRHLRCSQNFARARRPRRGLLLPESDSDGRNRLMGQKDVA